MSEPLPRGFARAPAAARDWWTAVTSDPRWESLGTLDRHHCVEILRMRVDLANASSPAQRRQLAAEVHKSEIDLGLWQSLGREVKPARRYRVKRAPGDVRH